MIETILEEYYSNGFNHNVAISHRYQYLLKWAILKRVKATDENYQKVLEQAEKCITWLTELKFFEGPASSRYHESFSGGLCCHSLRVAEQIVDLLNCKAFSNVSPDSAVLIALVHDWCKIMYYESYEKNVKDKNGNWIKETAFRRANDPMISLGHGVSSLYLAMKWFNLDQEECNAIRWHMGEYNVANNEIDELQYANMHHPLVYLIQFADRLACTSYASKAVEAQNEP